MKVWKFSTNADSRSPSLRGQARLPWPSVLVGVAGVVVSVVGFQMLDRADQDRMEAEMNRHADFNVSQVRTGVTAYEEILLALRTLFLFSEEVTFEEFSKAAQEIARRHAGIQALQWVPIVSAADRQTHEQQIRNYGIEGYEIRDRTPEDTIERAAERSFHLPIAYTAPMQGNERASGYDLSQGPTIRELELARDTGRPALSQKLSLIQKGTDRHGLIFIVPVFATADVPETIEERSRALRGFVQGVFLAHDMLEACFPQGIPAGLDLAIYENSTKSEATLLFGEHAPSVEGQKSIEKKLTILNRSWTLVYAGKEEWLSKFRSKSPLMALMGGLAFTVLFSSYLGTIVQRAQKVESLVRRRTQQVERMMVRLEHEVNERREREALLRESEGRFHSLFDLSPDGIAIVRNRSVTLANFALLRLIGLNRHEEAEGVCFPDLVVPEDRAQIEDLLENVQKRGSSMPFCRMRLLREGEDPVETEVCAALVILEGKPAAQLVVRDCSARLAAEARQRELQNRFQEAQKLESLGVLAGGIAHDFNNLLTGVIGNASLIRMTQSPTSPMLELVQAIETSATRAADLCRQMLAYSGRGKVQIQAVSLTDLVEESVALLQLSVSKKATLRFDLAPDLPAVMADVTQMRQVVMNLIINASDALDDQPGTIAVKTQLLEVDEGYLHTTVFGDGVKSGQYATLEVADSGHGMDEETMARIFEPFFTTKFTGRGLGLSAVMGIIRSHEGTLKVYSEPGRGTTFKLLLPVCLEAAAPLPAPDNTDEDWRGKGTVLLVDDEPVVRAVTVKMLQTLGFDVIEAGDGQGAVSIFGEYHERVEVAVVDLTMPKLDGFGTFRELRKIKPTIRVILTSGFNEQEAVSQFYGKGLSGFVQKPFRLAALRTALQKALDQP